jgi:hypothetical protein
LKLPLYGLSLDLAPQNRQGPALPFQATKAKCLIAIRNELDHSHARLDLIGSSLARRRLGEQAFELCGGIDVFRE